MQDADYHKKVSGKDYILLLSDLHQHLKPSTYLEIGVFVGSSLERASCASIAVDPSFVYEKNVIGNKPICHFYQMPSDDFFSSNSPTAIFGKTIDMAFLDGMHLFEFLLRDFINTEKHCRKDSTVILHDCLPPGFYMTTRTPEAMDSRTKFPHWWTGDVWKIVPTLLKYRPDLSIIVTDCTPTGLVIVSNLDPKDGTLAENYEKILSEFKVMDREEYESYWRSVNIIPFAVVCEQMSRETIS